MRVPATRSSRYADDGRFGAVKPTGEPEHGLGAYGLRLWGLDGLGSFLVRAPDSWTPLRLVCCAGPVAVSAERVGPRDAELLTATGASIHIDIDQCQAVFTAPLRPGLDEVVHPYLASVAAVTAFWRGCESFHAAVVAGRTGAWALVGERQAGKSSTLAALAAGGHEVVSDDMLVLRGMDACAGPRSIDLRPETAKALGVGVELGRIGTRERWRVHVGHTEAELPLRGWIFLEWSTSLERTTLRTSETLRRLLPQRGVRLPPPRPEALLELAELPGLLLRRPRDLVSLPATLTLIEEVIG